MHLKLSEKVSPLDWDAFCFEEHQLKPTNEIILKAYKRKGELWPI